MLPMILASDYHLPVLLPEVITSLKIKPGKKYIDATLGGGGYSFEILKRGGVVLGIDADRDAIEYVKRKFQISNFKFQIDKELFLAQGNFADLKSIAQRLEFGKVDGVLFDLGMSTYQLEHSGRGFSYRGDEPLDMRMDQSQSTTAADIINSYSTKKLYEILTKFAEELHSWAIADTIVRVRSVKGPILTTRQLVSIIDEVLDRVYLYKRFQQKAKLRQNTRARIFQALRIVVNNELDNLKKGLTSTFELLAREGRLAVLSYHSLEDRIVKLMLREGEKQSYLQIITRKPIRPSQEELLMNTSARSAKLRIAQKL